MTYTIEVSYDSYDPLGLKMSMSDESMARDYAEELAEELANVFGRKSCWTIVVKEWDLLKHTEIKLS